MRTLVSFARAVDAQSLLDITRAHIDGCLYHGQVEPRFRRASRCGRRPRPRADHAERRRDRPDSSGPDPAVALRSRRRRGGLMKAHEELGCHPSFTCAPYQTRFRPVFGEQIAWGESNAIVFANSVIGARTNRYGDFIDLCCAITGRAPAWGLHLDEHRRGQILFRLTGFTASRASRPMPCSSRSG